MDRKDIPVSTSIEMGGEIGIQTDHNTSAGHSPSDSKEATYDSSNKKKRKKGKKTLRDKSNTNEEGSCCHTN